MKKRLLMSALAVVCALCTYAEVLGPGQYAFTASQRVRISGENLFSMDALTDAEGNPYSTDTWAMEPGAGPNGEDVIQSQAATADAALCFRSQLEPGTYVVSFDVKGNTDGNLVVDATANNYADVFVNTDGSRVYVAGTEEAPVTRVAALTSFNSGWKTVNFVATVDQDQWLVMHFEKFETGMQICNFSVNACSIVFDTRKATAKLNFMKKLLVDPNFDVPEAAEAKEELTGIVEGIEGQMEAGELDDITEATDALSMLEETFESYLGVTSSDLTWLIPGLDILSVDKYGRGANFNTKFKLNLTGGNWGHIEGSDALRSAIQGSYANSGTYNAFHEDLPAGKYFFSAEIRNASTGKDSWPCIDTYNFETTCKIFVGKDSVELPGIVGEEFQQFYLVGEVTEDGQVRAGIEWPGKSSGCSFEIRNTQMRAFNPNVKADVEHIQAFKKFVEQWNAAKERRVGVMKLQDNANYPWSQQTLTDARAALDPLYVAQEAKGWMADGKDTGVASTEELSDWALYQGIEEYSEPAEDGSTTRLEYQLVRRYQAAIDAVKESNKPLTDLQEAIDNAKKTRNTGAYLTGDRDTYKAHIQAAIEVAKDVIAKTTDASRDADVARLEATLLLLNAATDLFLSTVSIEPFIDIDFSNDFTAVPEDEEGAAGAYYIEGAKGRMYFPNKADANNSGTNFALGYGEEYMDVLRVGNGTAVVDIPEENQPGENEVLRVTFDMWYGSLSGKNAGVELRNADGTRVAGFSLNRYNGSLAYNDFNDVLSNGGEGLNLLKYVTGIGSRSESNAAIKNDGTNKSSFDLLVNYKDQTVTGIVVNSKNGTCDGKPMPFIADLTDTKVTRFALISNYNNADRRCWFDNLKISKYPLTDIEEDITETPWAEVSAIKNVSVEKAADNAVYSISGVRLNSVPSKGLYIQNGKKFVVK